MLSTPCPPDSCTRWWLIHFCLFMNSRTSKTASKNKGLLWANLKIWKNKRGYQRFKKSALKHNWLNFYTKGCVGLDALAKHRLRQNRKQKPRSAFMFVHDCVDICANKHTFPQTSREVQFVFQFVWNLHALHKAGGVSGRSHGPSYPFILVLMCALWQWSSYRITSVAVILLQDRGCKLSAVCDSRRSLNQDAHTVVMCTRLLLTLRRGMCSHLYIPRLEFLLERLQNITSTDWEGGAGACLVL